MWPWESKTSRAITEGYRQVAEEFGEGKVSPSDYVRAFADAKGDGKKAVALYAKRRAKEISSHIHNQLLAPPAPEPKKSESRSGVGEFVFVVGAIIVGVIIFAGSKSSPPTQQTPVATQAKPASPPSIPTPTPQSSVEPATSIQLYANPTAQIVSPPSVVVK